MNRKSKKIIIILLAAAVLISGAVFTAVKFKKLASPNSPETNLAENIAADVSVKTYIHPGYGFSFDYPSEWEVSYFSDEMGKTILAQKAGNPQQGVQVYIQSFDEPETSLTKQRILWDLPEMTIENEKAVTLASGVSALSFSGRDENFGQTREVWFVHSGFLYQITAPSGNQKILEEMINSWKLNN